MKMKILIIFLFFTGIIFISYVKSNKEEINYTIIGEKELFSNTSPPCVTNVIVLEIAEP